MLSSTTGIGQAALEADHRLEKRGRKPAKAFSRDQTSRAPNSRAYQLDGAAAEHQRRVAQRLGAAGQDQVGLALADVLVGGVDRLHAGAAIDLHGQRRHRLAHAEPQRRDARRVHLVGDDVDAAEDDLVERVGRERLAQQQRPPAGDREIDRRERARPAARLDERRAAAVDDVDRAAVTPLPSVGIAGMARLAIAICSLRGDGSRRGDSSSGAKSSTAIDGGDRLARRRSSCSRLGVVDHALSRAPWRRRGRAPCAGDRAAAWSRP